MARSSQRRFGWAVALGAGAIAMAAWASGLSSPVQFPENYKQGVHYATVERGNVREELYTSPEAIEAARKNQPLPDGTVILMEDYRDGKLLRYIAMEKKPGHGDTQPADVRAGDWAFQSFGPDRLIHRGENLNRCMACHRPQARNDFVFTYDRMRTLGSQRP